MLKILRQNRADLVAEGSDILNLASTQKRIMTAEESARLTEIEASCEALDKQIASAEKHQDRIRALGDVSTRQDDLSEADRRAADGREGGGQKFTSLGEQMRAIMHAGNPNRTKPIDARLKSSDGYSAGPTGMSEGIAADGGFLVQTEFVDDILKAAFEGGEVASRVRKIGVGANSNGIRANGIDETSRGEGQRWGGVRAYWTGEGGLKRDSKPRFKQISMELDKLTGLCYVTDELLQDTTALTGWISQAFREEFVFKIEDSILNGTGSGQPLGIFNSSATIVVDKVPGQAAGTLNAANIVAMWTRMSPSARRNAVWLINGEVEPQLYTLMMLVKNVAGTENVGGLAMPQVQYQPPGTNGNANGTLMGRPVIPVEYCAPLGTAGDIALVDLTQYLAIDKGAIQEASSIHVRFIYDETVFRWVYRYNGMPILDKPVLPYRGTMTKSPFVILANRT
jgi:HK97 family phage major capsid protein